MAERITVTSDACPDDARVVAFRAREAIGQPYECEVYFTTKKSDDVELEKALFRVATLTLDRKSDPRGDFVVRGVVGSIDHVHEEDDYALFSMTIVPRWWLLGVSEHSRIFVDKKLDEILREVVEQVGIQGKRLGIGELGLDPEDHVTQYRESDLAFLSRWIEREGLLYWFDHLEEDGEKLVVRREQPEEEVPGGPIAYHPLVDRTSPNFMSEPHLDRVRTRRAAMPKSVRVTDYDELKPRLEIKGEETVLRKSDTAMASFAPEHFFDPDKAADLAKYRAQALRAKMEVQEVEGNVVGLRPGRIFELTRHPRSALNQPYAVIQVEHTGIERGALAGLVRELLGVEHEELYRVKAVCLATTVEYRLPRRTPWPVVGSFEIARVDGEMDSEYAQLDDHGRYKLKFMFDEGLGKNGKASMWVRMMQPHAGNPEGMHFPLRKETEVVVSFLGGDPDRPVISGAVPNAETPSPITHRNQTHNILITGGRNKIEIEDLDGSQWFDLDCPVQTTKIHMGMSKPWNVAASNFGIHTDGVGVFTFGADWWTDVGGFHDEHVTGTVNQLYESTKTETVTAKVTESYNADHQTTVQGHRKITVNSGEDDTVHAGWKQTIDPILDQTINSIWKTTVSSTWNLNVGSTVNWQIGATYNVTSPQINIIGAQLKQTDASAKYFYVHQEKAVGIELTAKGLAVTGTGIKIELTGLSFAATGAKTEHVAIANSSVGAKHELTFLELLTGALHSEFTTLKIFG